MTLESLNRHPNTQQISAFEDYLDVPSLADHQNDLEGSVLPRTWCIGSFELWTSVCLHQSLDSTSLLSTFTFRARIHYSYQKIKERRTLKILIANRNPLRFNHLIDRYDVNFIHTKFCETARYYLLTWLLLVQKYRPCPVNIDLNVMWSSIRMTGPVKWEWV